MFEADGFLRAMETELRNLANIQYIDVMQQSHIKYENALGCVGKLRFSNLPPAGNEEILMSLFCRKQDGISREISELHLRQSISLVTETQQIGQAVLNDINNSRKALDGASLLIVDTNDVTLIACDALRSADRQTCRRTVFLIVLLIAALAYISFLVYLLLTKKMI